jgi:hypothetical protein
MTVPSNRKSGTILHILDAIALKPRVNYCPHNGSKQLSGAGPGLSSAVN